MLSLDFDIAHPASPSKDLFTIRLAILCVKLFESLSFGSLKKMQIELFRVGIARSARYIVKKKQRNNPIHDLVFASKFIHFRAPAFVYILDSVTKGRLSNWKPANGKRISLMAALRYLKLDPKDAYAAHYLNCYQLAKLSYKDSQNFLPRDVDIFLYNSESQLPLI